jgi:hypothetical protein
MQHYPSFERTRDIVERFNDLINETSELRAGGYEYYGASAWRAVDPIAYREGAFNYFLALENDGEITPVEFVAAIDLIDRQIERGI